jgi:arginine N-succinyltransferase
MLIVRPVALEDLDPLEALAKQTGVGLTTLPPDKKFLRKRIKASLASFEKVIDEGDSPAGEAYLFVMEELATKRIVGVCGIYAKTGGYEPFYSYRVETEHFQSAQIGIDKAVPILKLHEDHNGPSEVGSLFLHPDFRRAGSGRFLQLVRFLFVAEYPHLFEPTFITEIRGVSDEAGNSPFWDAIGRHFFGIDFKQADYLSVVNKKFIAELMPDHPIYISMLPENARAVIGKAHEQSMKAVENLKAEGFTYSNAVDIFDAGPCYECKRDEIRTVKESRRAIVGGSVDSPIESDQFMICTTQPSFRACVSGLLIEPPDRLRLPKDVIEALGVKAGQAVRYAALRTPKGTS